MPAFILSAASPIQPTVCYLEMKADNDPTGGACQALHILYSVTKREK